MKNGYALCSEFGLRAISTRLSKATAAEIDDLWGRVSIGLHGDVEVITPAARDGQRVAQAFCSALPVAYGNSAADNWRAFATLVLAAAYKATLLATALQAANGGTGFLPLMPSL
jgi:hypothetical protein